MVLVLAEEEFIAEKRESNHSDDGGRKGVRFLRDKVLRALVFPYGEARHTGAPRRQRVDLRELVERVPEA